MRAFNMQGRWYRLHKKPTIEDYLRLDVCSFKEKLALSHSSYVVWQWKSGHSQGYEATVGIFVIPEHGLWLNFRINGQLAEACWVPIVYTEPHFGGRRPWFLCPGCGKRVRLLYSGRLFLCSSCLGLSYAIRQRSPGDALLTAIWSRKYAIIQRLGGTESTLPSKPPYMHQHTYCQLKEFYDLTQLEIRAQTAALAQAVGMNIPAFENLRSEWKELKAWRKNRRLTRSHLKKVVNMV